MRDGGGGGGGDGGDGGGGDGGGGGDDGLGADLHLRDEDYDRLQVCMRRAMQTRGFQRLTQELRERRVAATGVRLDQSNAKLVTAHSQLLAAGFTELYSQQQRLQKDAQLHAEKLAREAAADALLVDVKKKEQDKFPIGCTKTIDAARVTGCHGDMTGQRYAVLKQIGPQQASPALYRSIMTAAVIPD